ncbi:MAG: GGDEF domain-containing protein [Alteromonadaceae bacterium]|nr:GGDEF domain-containing protein [Alteromonadaceae bacterium]MBB20684.1 GGDEF domain-containing protein [Rickettsiales bacterium]
MKVIWICIVLIFSGVANVFAAQAVVYSFSDEYQSLTSRLTTEPQRVLTELTNSAPQRDASNAVKAEYYAILSDTYYALTYPQKAIESAQKGLSFITEESEPWLYHNLKLIEATALEMAGVPIDALLAVNKAVAWAQANHNEETYILGLYVRGLLFTSLNEYSGAAENFLEAYSLSTQYTGKISKANIAGMIGVMYENRGDYKLAIPYYAEAVAHARKNNEPLNLSIVLFGLGSANFRAGNIDLGETQLIESADIARSLDDSQGVGYALKQLAKISIKKQDYALAEKRLKRAAEIFADSENRPIDFQISKSLFEVALATGELDKAERHRDRAKEFLNPTTMPSDTIEIEQLEAELAAAQGDLAVAYAHMQQALTLSGEYHATRNSEQLHRLRAIYRVRASEQENKILEHQNRLQRFALNAQEQRNVYLWAFLGILLLVCCLLAVMVYRVKAQSKALTKLAITDDLTGLYNRRHIIEQLERQVNAANRYKYDLCVAIIDLDFFKKINDSYGHAVGDRVLIEFSNICSKNLRQSDIIGRIGGEEFLVILPHTNLQDGYNALDGLRHKISMVNNVVDIKDLSISASIGLTFNTDGRESMQLMADADTALYQAKTLGRDQVVIHPQSTPVNS